MSNITILDCRGLACPQPVLKTKGELDRPGAGKLQVIVDNPTARENVTLLARNLGHQVEAEERGGLHYINITRAGAAGAGANISVQETAPARAASTSAVDTVYFITTSTLGQGSPDLGQVLMKSLFVTLAEQPAPAAILLLNTGVHLALEGSPVLEFLARLAEGGAEVLACGTCLDYYRVREKLALGAVSNMYEIHSRLDRAAKVITVA
ncbi:MAG: sulfurtransferase-like selenium metabolism protein YedF [Bacillota bacterium]